MVLTYVLLNGRMDSRYGHINEDSMRLVHRDERDLLSNDIQARTQFRRVSAMDMSTTP